MTRIHDLLADHKNLFDSVPGESSNAVIDPQTWWLEVVIDEYSNGILLCLALTIEDRGEQGLRADLRLLKRSPEDGLFWSKSLPGGNFIDLRGWLKRTLRSKHFEVTVADTTPAENMIRFVSRFWRELVGGNVVMGETILSF